MKFSIVFAIICAALAEAHDVPSLSTKNYDAMTVGKTVFIKFFAPWCGHCKKMKHDWEKLSQEWDGHNVGLVTEVDCTAEGKSLCETHEIREFPTLKYGDPSNLEDYQGGHSYKELAEFATENLKPVCSPANLDLCDDERKKSIESYMALSDDELNNKISAEEEKLEKAEEDFKAAVEKLQAEYQKLSKDKDSITSEVKASGLGLMKSNKPIFPMLSF